MLHKIGQALSGILLVVLIIACLLLVAPRILGIQLFSVLSGSMEPAFGVNDLVYAFPTSYEQVKVGDPITFKLNENTIVTHRVIEKDDASQSLYTKGDANETADGSPTAYNDVIGVVRFYIPMVGGILQSISSGSGRIISLTIAAVVILLTMLLTINGQPDKEETGDQLEDCQCGRIRGKRNRGAVSQRSYSILDEEWGSNDGYEISPSNRRQPRMVKVLDEKWELDDGMRRTQKERQREQSSQTGRRRRTNVAQDHWLSDTETGERYSNRREMQPSHQHMRQARRADDFQEERWGGTRSGGTVTNRTDRDRRSGIRPEVLSKGNESRRKDNWQGQKEHRVTQRQPKKQLPPAWR